MKNFKYILTGLFTVSALTMINPAMAAEEAPQEETKLYDGEVIEYDDSNLDDLLKNKDAPYITRKLKSNKLPTRTKTRLMSRKKRKKNPIQIA